MTAKISRRDIKILIVLAGVLILLLSYLLVYKNFTDKKEAADAEIAQLQPELDQLRQYEAHKQEYLEGTETAKANISAVLSQLPSSVLLEDQVVFAKNMEDDMGVNITEEDFEEPITVEQFKGVTLDTIDDPSSQIDMTAYKKPVTITADMDYDQFKDSMDYVFDHDGLMGFDSITADYDSEKQLISVTLAANSYYLAYEGAPEESHDVPDVGTGVTDPFGTREQ